MHITPAYDQGKSYLNLAKFRFCLSTMYLREKTVWCKSSGRLFLKCMVERQNQNFAGFRQKHTLIKSRSRKHGEPIS